MLCEKCGKYHPPLEPCYCDLPNEIVVHFTAPQLEHASDRRIVKELQKRGILFPPRPDADSPDYSLPVLASQHLTNRKRIAWRRICLKLIRQSDSDKVDVVAALSS